MGASFQMMTVKFCKADELKKIYNNEIENLRYEYGADPYNGDVHNLLGSENHIDGF